MKLLGKDSQTIFDVTLLWPICGQKDVCNRLIWGKAKGAKAPNNKALIVRALDVVPPGVETRTHGFSVRCSTN